MRALVVVDMQNDFIDGALGSKEAQSIVENVKKKIREYEERGDTVIYTQDTHHEETYPYTEEGRNLPVLHCICGTPGWELFNGAESFVYRKEGVGSFNASNFLQLLASHDVSGVPQIEVVGLCTDICVISNAVILRSALLNAHIIVDAACCAGVTPERHDTALNAMKALQIEVINQGKEPWR